MAYITQAQMEDRTTPELLAKFVKYSAASSDYVAAVADIIYRAEARVNSYLSSIFTVPVTTTGMIEEMCLAIAEWELYRRGSGNVPDKIRQAYEDALKDLRDIAKGVLSIGGTVVPAASASVSGLELASADPVFDVDNMNVAGW
jgi:phage gp36-like protein